MRLADVGITFQSEPLSDTSAGALHADPGPQNDVIPAERGIADEPSDWQAGDPCLHGTDQGRSQGLL
jgi:hypothetical protein